MRPDSHRSQTPPQRCQSCCHCSDQVFAFLCLRGDLLADLDLYLADLNGDQVDEFLNARDVDQNDICDHWQQAVRADKLGYWVYPFRGRWMMCSEQPVQAPTLTDWVAPASCRETVQEINDRSFVAPHDGRPYRIELPF